jgi:integrase/recombinase XerD
VADAEVVKTAAAGPVSIPGKKKTNPWKRTHNLAMVQLMLQAGLRISEVVDLDAEDVNLERSTLVVRSGKGGMYRVALMNPDLKRAMERETHSTVWLLSEWGKEWMTRQGVH